MSDRGRSLLFFVSAAGVAAVALCGVAGLSPFGSFAGAYGAMILRVAVLERHVLNAATAVNFDYRGFDTMGEEFILFTSIAGVVLIFAELRGDAAIHPEAMESAGDRGSTAALRAVGTALVALIAGMGMNVAVHTSITPGGGFQGGAVFGSIVACIFVGLGYFALDRTANKPFVDFLECAGAAAYAAIGVALAFSAGVFLKNALHLGQTGAVISGGSIFLINAFVFLEVASGFVLLLLVYLHQTKQRGEGPN